MQKPASMFSNDLVYPARHDGALMRCCCVSPVPRWSCVHLQRMPCPSGPPWALAVAWGQWCAGDPSAASSPRPAGRHRVTARFEYGCRLVAWCVCENVWWGTLYKGCTLLSRVCVGMCVSSSGWVGGGLSAETTSVQDLLCGFACALWCHGV